MITVAELCAVMPTAHDLAGQFIDPLNTAMAKFYIDNPLREAAFIAQVAHESQELHALSENLNYSSPGLMATFPTHFTRDEADRYEHQPERIANRVYARRSGNGDEASGDGWLFRGRGLFDLTGRGNYDLCGGALNLDLVAHPEILEAPEGACNSAGWFWQTKGLNGLADAQNFLLITKRINGGAIGWASRNAYYNKALKLLGA